MVLTFTNDELLPKTNNLVELFYKITFPRKEFIEQSKENEHNRLNNIKWMGKMSSKDTKKIWLTSDIFNSPLHLNEVSCRGDKSPAVTFISIGKWSLLI